MKQSSEINIEVMKFKNNLYMAMANDKHPEFYMNEKEKGWWKEIQECQNSTKIYVNSEYESKIDVTRFAKPNNPLRKDMTGGNLGNKLKWFFDDPRNKHNPPERLINLDELRKISAKGVFAPEANDPAAHAPTVQKARSYSKFRVIVSTVPIINDDGSITKMKVLTACAPNLMGTSMEDYDRYLENGRLKLKEYEKDCNKIAQLMLFAAKENNINPLKVAEFGLGAYVKKLSQKADKDAACKIMYKAFLDAAKKNNVKIDWVIWDKDPDRDPVAYAEALNAGIFKGESQYIKAEVGNVVTDAQKWAKENPGAGQVNNGSDRTIGGAQYSVNLGTTEEQLCQRSFTAEIQSVLNPNFAKDINVVNLSENRIVDKKTIELPSQFPKDTATMGKIKPANRQAPWANINPAVPPKPMANINPAVAKAPLADVKPAVVTAPLADVKPAVVTAPLADVKPAVVTAPLADVKPAVVKAPLADVKPAVVKAPLADVKPAIATAPLTNIKPTATTGETKPADRTETKKHKSRSSYFNMLAKHFNASVETITKGLQSPLQKAKNLLHSECGLHADKITETRDAKDEFVVKVQFKTQEEADKFAWDLKIKHNISSNSHPERLKRSSHRTVYLTQQDVTQLQAQKEDHSLFIKNVLENHLGVPTDKLRSVSSRNIHANQNVAVYFNQEKKSRGICNILFNMGITSHTNPDQPKFYGIVTRKEAETINLRFSEIQKEIQFLNAELNDSAGIMPLVDKKTGQTNICMSFSNEGEREGFVKKLSAAGIKPQALPEKYKSIEDKLIILTKNDCKRLEMAQEQHHREKMINAHPVAAGIKSR